MLRPALRLVLRFSLLSFSFACTALPAQSLRDSPIVFHSGQWDVHRIKDAMSDATVCAGIPGGNFDVTLYDGRLTIALPDNVKRVQLRFDDDTALAPRAATRSEFGNRRIEIDGSDFAALTNARRLRYQAQLAEHDTVAGDINLDGVFLAHGVVAAGCAGNPINAKPAAADNCTPTSRQRMHDRGMPAADIDAICHT